MLISAIMVTGKCVTRAKFAKVAVRCFLEQTHAEKELIIINDGGLPIGFADSQIREFIVPHSPEITLGDLRNFGLEHAKGNLVLQWDDDDWHSPQRMEAQASWWRNRAAVVLKKQIRYSFLTKIGFLWTNYAGISGTILHQAGHRPRYKSLRAWEDGPFLNNFPHRIIIDSPLPLYIKFYHGANTCPEKSIMAKRHPKACSKLSGKDQQLLESVLKNYYDNF